MYQTYYRGNLYRTGAIPRTIPGCKLTNIQSATDEQRLKHGIECVPYTPEPPTQEEIMLQVQAETKAAIQNMLDSTAAGYEFDDIHSAGIWRGARPMAQELFEWGAACWDLSEQIRDDVLTGKRPMPTVEDVLAEMPEFGGEA